MSVEPTPDTINAVAAGRTIAQTALEWRRGNDYEAAIIDDFLLSIGINPDQTVAEFRSGLRTAEDRALLDAAGSVRDAAVQWGVHHTATEVGRLVIAVDNARRVAAGGTEAQP